MMENIRIRCRSCNKEVVGCAGKSVSCGCPNRASVIGDVVSAVDMDQVIMLNSYIPKKKQKEGLTEQDLQWQEERRKRKVRKLDFEVR
tara:strand:+ start:135 stop:398 length:264 start_codon:yes stop_codon:yes gene_type:complete